MTSTYIVQIASVPGHQVGQRRFEQNRYLHELLLSLLTNEDQQNQVDKEQIQALRKIVPQHEIILRSGFSQTARWGLEPNMFLKIDGDEKQARMISALFGEAFCQDGIGIGGGGVDGQDHSVLILNSQWENEDERLELISMILQRYPMLSAQLDVNNQIAFHDYSMTSSVSFPEIISLLQKTNREYFIEEKQMKSELVDRTEYDDLLLSIQSVHLRRIFDDLRYAHARLFSGYGCASFTLPSLSIGRRHKQRREQKKDRLDKSHRRQSLVSPPHLCSLIFTSRRPCMCLTDNNCFCHYTLILTTHRSSISR